MSRFVCDRSDLNVFVFSGGGEVGVWLQHDGFCGRRPHREVETIKVGSVRSVYGLCMEVMMLSTFYIDTLVRREASTDVGSKFFELTKAVTNPLDGLNQAKGRRGCPCASGPLGRRAPARTWLGNLLVADPASARWQCT